MGPPAPKPDRGAPRAATPAPLRLVRPDEELPPPASFEELFRRYHRLVATIGLRILGRPGEVDDFVQDVFLECHRGFGSIREPAAAKGWVRAIAVRMAIKRLRRRRLAAALGLDHARDGAGVTIDANQESALFLRQIYQALEGVPAKARVVWVLRTIDGEKLEDIASLTQMGLSSVKRHLAAASAHLQEVLGE